jgi:hypothetical protein
MDDSLSLYLILNKETVSSLKLKLVLFETGYFIILKGEFEPWLLLTHLLTSKKSL